MKIFRLCIKSGKFIEKTPEIYGITELIASGNTQVYTKSNYLSIALSILELGKK